MTSRRKGFTIIELMLAMSFISVLLLGIAMTIIQIGSIYSKGLSVKEVNQAARDVATDFRRTISSSSMRIPTDGSDSVNIVTIMNGTNQVGGRLCTGEYSYVWNTIKGVDLADSRLTKYEDDTSKLVTLVKVSDSEKLYCAKSGTGALLYPNIRGVDTEIAQELLESGDHSLSLAKLNFIATDSATDLSTEETLYTLEYTITSGKVTAMNADQTTCLEPGEDGADPAYCNVQQFTLVLRAGSEV